METQTVRTVATLSLIILSLQSVAAEDYAALPKGQGRDVMVLVCAQCHSPELAAQQNLDPEGWKALVDQMANNGAQASEAEFGTITKYLATSFPANRTGRSALPSQGEPRPRAGSEPSGKRLSNALLPAPSKIISKRPAHSGRASHS